jgi:hypothetical protein
LQLLLSALFLLVQVTSATMPFGKGPAGKKHPHFGHLMYPPGTIKQLLLCHVLADSADADARWKEEGVSCSAESSLSSAMKCCLLIVRHCTAVVQDGTISVGDPKRILPIYLISFQTEEPE